MEHLTNPDASVIVWGCSPADDQDDARKAKLNGMDAPEDDLEDDELDHMLQHVLAAAFDRDIDAIVDAVRACDRKDVSDGHVSGAVRTGPTPVLPVDSSEAGRPAGTDKRQFCRPHNPSDAVLPLT